MVRIVCDLDELVWREREVLSEVLAPVVRPRQRIEAAIDETSPPVPVAA
jgi:hypothetical protein